MKFLKTVFQNNIFSIINLYPPFLGAGVKIKKLNDNLDLHVSMNLNIFNRNYVGVHFGGSLYSMCDPFYMLIVMKKLGRDYIVWDKEASIKFKSPGKGKVHATFIITDEDIKDILENTLDGKPYQPTFLVNVLGPDNKIVAEVSKTLWIKKK